VPKNSSSNVTILFIGDVVGSIGRKALASLLPDLQARHNPTFTVVNGENAAGGIGITPKIAEEFFNIGVDVITLGNHTYRHRSIYPYLDSDAKIIRPANYLSSQPGRGACTVEKEGVKLGVINLSGNLYVDAAHPFMTSAENELEKLADVDHVLVDMHGEATSEKVGLGWHLDGKVTAVVGTHTHVPTADARVLPSGTAYISDVGMTGSRAGVIGVKKHQAIESMRSKLPVRFETAEEDPWLMGVVINAAGKRSAESIQQILEPALITP